MAAANATRRICDAGHTYYKSSDCPVCPVCAAESAPEQGFMADLSAPARRALEHAGWTTLAELSRRTKREILDLHGVGPATIGPLEEALKRASLAFRDG